MPRSTTIPTSKLLELYQSGLTLKEVAIICGITKQAVHERLKRAEYSPRQRISKHHWIDRDLLVDLYVKQELSLAEIGDRLNVSLGKIANDLVRHGIEVRRPGSRSKYRRYFQGLEKGESVLIPWSGSKNPHPTLQTAAKRAGIKVSIKSIGNSTVRVTKIGLTSR